MFFSAVAVHAENESERLGKLISWVEERCDIDPDSFAVNVKMMEGELVASKDAGIRAILHSVLAEGYSSLAYSNINVRDRNCRELYDSLSADHRRHVFDDMEVLATLDARKYEPLVEMSEDDVYGHNLLMAILQKMFLCNRYSIPQERDSIIAMARKIFLQNGDRASDAYLRFSAIRRSGRYDDEGRQARCRALVALRDSVKELIPLTSLIQREIDEASNEISTARVTLRTLDGALPGKPSKLQIAAENSEAISLEVFRYNGTDKKDRMRTDGECILTRRYPLLSKEKISEARVNFIALRDTVTDSLSLPAGHYVYRAIIEGDTVVENQQITSLQLLLFDEEEGKTRAVVVDTRTGHPVPRSAVVLYTERGYNSDAHTTFVTDKKGELIFDRTNYYRIRAVRDTTQLETYLEDATPTINLYGGYYQSNLHTSVEGEIFTDRRVYRPGQTIHAYSVLYTLNGDDTRVVKSGQFVFSLSLNGETLKSGTLMPNEYGSVSCDLQLPSACKLGEFWLTLSRVDENELHEELSVPVRIEEYKRPTYSVEFAKDTVKYAMEDAIVAHLSAETFAGTPVQEGKVRYRIECCRRRYLWWGSNDWTFVREGSVLTDENGKYDICFSPSEEETVSRLASKALVNEDLFIRISATVTDKTGESHETFITYVVALKPSKAVEEPEEIVRLSVSKETVSAGDKVTVKFVPEQKDAYVFYYVLANDKIIDKKTFKSPKSFSRKLKVSKEWSNGAMVTVVYVMDGEVHTYRQKIAVAKPDKTLRLSWHTFRDHLQPGAQETWSLDVKDKDGMPVTNVELLASMYDVSLDQISAHKWQFSIPFNTYVRGISTAFTRSYQSLDLYLSYTSALPDFIYPSFDMLKTYFEGMGGQHLLYASSAVAPVRNNRLDGMELQEVPVKKKPSTMNADQQETAMVGTIAGLSCEASDEPASVQPSLRQNFSETAFYYPHLTTDSEGRVQWTFTLPESLTTWRFQGFAHTEDVHFGLLTATTVASKSFMVQPQMPRFVRKGDTAVIPVKVTNTDSIRVDGMLSPSLSFGHLSPVGREGLADSVLYKTEIPFSVEAGKTEIYYVTLDSTLFQAQPSLPLRGEGSGEGALVFEVIGVSGDTSDGERNLLPVLPSREEVTENIPFYLDGAGNKTVDLTSLYNSGSSSASDRKLEIGYTDNPALEVFKGLMTVQYPRFENAPCLAAALYSNIVMQDMYKKLGDKIETFNPLSSDSIAFAALKKLKELQLTDGSWSWFRGMQSSPYITLAVAEHLDRLVKYMQRNGMSDSYNISELLGHAISSLDAYELLEYTYRKEHKLALEPSHFDLRYMQLCSLNETEMLKTYLAAIPKHLKSLDIKTTAEAAVVLKRFNRQADYKKFTDRIKHYLVYKPGFGRYFATDRANYSWQDYRIPTQLSAMRCLDDQTLIPDMQLWLLRQKQTQMWQNPLNAIAVADYLLQDKTNLREPQTPQMLLNGKVVNLEGNKTTITDQSLLQNISSLTINRAQPSLPLRGEGSGVGASFGYARATFTEEASKLSTYTTGELSISRQIVKRTDKKVTLRLSIHADRDMDFVSVTSKIPANFEPVILTSGYRWDAGVGYYLELRDAATHIFFDHFRRGTTTVDIEYYITRPGTYHSGAASVQCEYAPEFGGYAPEY